MVHPDEDFGKRAQDKPDHTDRRNAKGGINPLDSLHIDRLRDSMQWSATQIAPFVERHVEAIRLYAGSRYGRENHLDKTPMNLMRLAVDVWLRQLAAQTPKCLVLTRQPDLRTDAYELELATDHLLREIDFGTKLSSVVRSAIFTMGAMKVGITSKYLADATGFTAESGQPYADPILFEDWLHDMNARNQEEWDWCGNRYRLPYDVVMQNPNFNKKVLDMLTSDEDNSMEENLGGTHSRSWELSGGRGMSKTEYRKHVELWDIWIPGDNLYVTLPVQSGLKALEVREWEGPEHGPFPTLAFSHVPGNVMPSAPAQNMADLQDIITRLFNQLARQAERQKTLTIADGRAENDGTAAAIMEGEDGAVIKATHIDSVKEMKYGGVDQGNMGFVVWLKEMFSYMGGNIDAMGGLAQQAGTLGQEQLLVKSSSEMIRDMQSRVVTYTEKVVKDLAWYMYSDPLTDLKLSKRVDGVGEIPFHWGPESRDAEFFEFSYQIQPYSLQNKGPEARLQTIMSLTTSLFLPLAPQLQQWGMTMNLQKLMEIISKYTDLPELEEIIVSDAPTQAEMVGIQASASQEARQAGRQSPVTQRNYKRENVSGGKTQQSQSGDLMKSLMSAGASKQ